MEEFSTQPNATNFYKIPTTIQKCLYSAAICCTNRKIGNGNSKLVLECYNKLLLLAGINDRVSMSASIGRSYKEGFKGEKGIIKARCIKNLMHKYKVKSESVYFYDNDTQIIKDVEILGINNVLVKKGLDVSSLDSLISKKKFDVNSVKLVLLDFDETLIRHKIPKQEYNYDLEYLYTKYMGGKERMLELFYKLRVLEQLEVKIGIITMNVRHRIEPLLIRMEWVD